VRGAIVANSHVLIALTTITVALEFNEPSIKAIFLMRKFSSLNAVRQVDFTERRRKKNRWEDIILVMTVAMSLGFPIPYVV